MDFTFFQSDGKVNIEWVAEKAEEFANSLEIGGERKDNKRIGGMSTTQLRNFYNEFLRIRDTPSTEEERIILVKLLSAKVQYRRTAKASEIPEKFVKFMKQLVMQIGDSSDRFEKACNIMEAVIGYFPKDK